ncbi:hypothetical protein HOY82DRAFT_617006 [Tuber indicum]|nr:hypothetical protein HOY82DRAFT_617006 [Tuber indicum]
MSGPYQSYISGNYSGNSGSNNTFGSNNYNNSHNTTIGNHNSNSGNTTNSNNNTWNGGNTYDQRQDNSGQDHRKQINNSGTWMEGGQHRTTNIAGHGGYTNNGRGPMNNNSDGGYMNTGNGPMNVNPGSGFMNTGSGDMNNNTGSGNMNTGGGNMNTGSGKQYNTGTIKELTSLLGVKDSFSSFGGVKLYGFLAATVAVFWWFLVAQ